MTNQGHKPAGSRDATGKKNGGQFRSAEAKPRAPINFFHYGDRVAPIKCEWTQPAEANADTPCPWGQVEMISSLGIGIAEVSAENGSGIKLSQERNDAMPDAFRSEDGWYEDDDEFTSSLPLMVYFDDMDYWYTRRINRRDVMQTVKDHHPYKYEAVTGETISDGKSFVKDQARFFYEHKNDWVEYAAKDSRDRQSVRVSACRGGRYKNRSSVETRVYDIPIDVYDRRSKFGMVINESKYQPIETGQIKEALDD